MPRVTRSANMVTPPTVWYTHPMSIPRSEITREQFVFGTRHKSVTDVFAAEAGPDERRAYGEYCYNGDIDSARRVFSEVVARRSVAAEALVASVFSPETANVVDVAPIVRMQFEYTVGHVVSTILGLHPHLRLEIGDAFSFASWLRAHSSTSGMCEPETAALYHAVITEAARRWTSGGAALSCAARYERGSLRGVPCLS